MAKHKAAPARVKIAKPSRVRAPDAKAFRILKKVQPAPRKKTMRVAADAQAGTVKAKLVAGAMPGWRVVDPAEVRKQRAQKPAPAARADAVSPPLQAMKRKSFAAKGIALASADAGESDNETAAPQRLTDVVTVESGSGEKKTRKVIGVRDGKIVWRQG